MPNEEYILYEERTQLVRLAQMYLRMLNAMRDHKPVLKKPKITRVKNDIMGDYYIHENQLSIIWPDQEEESQRLSHVKHKVDTRSHAEE